MSESPSSRVGAAAVAEEAAAVLLVPRSGWCGGVRCRWRLGLRVEGDKRFYDTGTIDQGC